ncbi:tetratricopeptide repeat protein [Ferruginibacter sp. SUN002]|uniref:tetratricopeptide repeat protein n=1 Tax=Ferruginibacter sp. SUN002 TaxID=2937789 RepID=UPI003D35B005
MAEKQVIDVANVETNEVVAKAKDFWSKFSKPIIYAGSAVILLAGGWLAYKNFIIAPKNAKAADAIFAAEHLYAKMAQNGFNKDSINLALNGGNGITGFLKIAKDYKGTDAGNLANYYAGACYLQGGDFANAIKYLKGFSTSASQIQTMAYSMLGDASAELKKNDEALDYYKKASSVNEKDEFMSAFYLFHAGNFAEKTGKPKEAIELYQKLKTDYPKSSQAGEIDKYLAKLGVLN